MSLLTHVKTVKGQQRQIVITLFSSKLEAKKYRVKYNFSIKSHHNSNYTQRSTKWLMNDGKLLQIAELFHGRHLLFDRLHLQLNAVVSVLLILGLVVQAPHPAGAFAVMQQFALHRLVGATHHGGHRWHGHQVDEGSIKKSSRIS